MGNPLRRLTFATIETIIEAIEKEHWTAFVNNTFDFTAVVFNNKKLIQQIKEAKNDSSVLKKLEQEMVEKWGKRYELSVAEKIFKLIWAALIYNTSTCIEIADIVKEHKLKNTPINEKII